MTTHRLAVRRFFGRLCRPCLLLVVVLLLGLGLQSGAHAANRFVTTGGSDGGNSCLSPILPCKTIGHAINEAAPDDRITVGAGTYNPALGEIFPLSLGTNLTIEGSGPAVTIIDAAGTNRVMFISSERTVTLSGLKVTGGGNVTGGPGILNHGTLIVMNVTVSGNTAASSNQGSQGGGGIFNNGTVTLTNSTVSGNTVSISDSTDAAVGNGAFGGGILNNDSLTLTNSTVSGNAVSASGSGSRFVLARGGGIESFGALTLINSTVSGNTASVSSSGSGAASAVGAGINQQGGPATLTNSTVSGNTVSAIGSGTGQVEAIGGGISGVATLRNTIVADNVGGNCIGTPTSLGHNLSSDGTCHFSAGGDLNNANLHLSPLADNGGPTRTHALLAGSPAIDGGDNATCPSTDQRGSRRPVDGDNLGAATCDSGAFEANTVATTLLGAVLPTERTAQAPIAAAAALAVTPSATTVTAFATILNTGFVTAVGCAIAPFTPIQATFLYQTTNPDNSLAGTPNTPASILSGQGQTFVIAFTPTAAFPVTEVQLSMACTNSGPAPITPGVNTFRLRAASGPAPDVVALAATGPPNDGILRLASVGAFAVATVNLGAPGLITASANTGAILFPVTIALCQTDPQSGQCLADPTPTVQTQVATGASPTFGVFVSSDQPIAFNPETRRIQVYFEGNGGGGGTSVAVCTASLCP